MNGRRERKMDEERRLEREKNMNGKNRTHLVER